MINHINYNPELLLKRWVGYFDLMGVKQLNKTKNHISIFVAISDAIEKLKERTTAWSNVRHAWFSDTFIVYSKDDTVESIDAIDNISRWFCYFLITGNIPVRGAISCDSFYADSDNGLFFGEALIEAYEYGEAQDWIGFLLCPSAEERLKHLGLPAEISLNYVYADIPFNKRTDNLCRNLLTCILGNWVSSGKTIIDKLVQMKERITDQDIRLKYERSIDFIQKNRRILSSENNR